jgi:hypothetical protein
LFSNATISPGAWWLKTGRLLGNAFHGLGHQRGDGKALGGY